MRKVEPKKDNEKNGGESGVFVDPAAQEVLEKARNNPKYTIIRNTCIL